MSSVKKNKKSWREKLGERHGASIRLLRDVWSGAATDAAKEKKAEVVTRRSVSGYFLGYGFRSPVEVSGAARRAGNFAVGELDSEMRFGQLVMTWDDDAIGNFAELVSIRCKKIIRESGDFSVLIDSLSDIAERYALGGVFDNCSEKNWMRDVVGIMIRMCHKGWWHRRIRRVKIKNIDEFCRARGMVNARGMLYCSDEAVRLRLQQVSRNRAYLESVQAENDLGQKYLLSDLSELSVSNPQIRRAELMMRMAGFEHIAEQSGHVGVFFTVTAPSFFHPMRQIKNARGRVVRVEKNPRYKGASVRDAQGFLCRSWSRIRAAWARHELRCYGFRVVEPHADGCPHWHMLLFFESVESAKRADYFLRREMIFKSEYQEQGAQENRVKTVWIDKKRGRATGYIAKYISKNIDGHHVGDDWFGADAVDSAVRIAAWASAHSIRQFQQIGGPSVQVWRELRRVSDQSVECEQMRAIIAAADGADWPEYCRLQGGVLASRRQHFFSLVWKGGDDLGAWDRERLGLLDFVKKNQYGESVRGGIYGVKTFLNSGLSAVCTRFRQWTIERVVRVFDSVGSGLARLLGPLEAGSWSGRGWECEEDFIDYMRGAGNV